jgi:hypothetical protein
VLVVFGVGAVMVWQRTAYEKQRPVVAEAPRQLEEPSRRMDPGLSDAQTFSVNTSGVTQGTTPTVAQDTKPPRRIQRAPISSKPKPTFSVMELSSEGAKVFNKATTFPIETSLQSVKVSLDDGLGNARTISFPTVSFGSQRVLTPASQFAPKGAW